MNGYRMLSDEDIANYKRQGWEEVEIAELELYLLNTTSGAIIQLNDAFKAFTKPTLELGTKLVEPIIQQMYLWLEYTDRLSKKWKRK